MAGDRVLAKPHSTPGGIPTPPPQPFPDLASWAQPCRRRKHPAPPLVQGSQEAVGLGTQQWPKPQLGVREGPEMGQAGRRRREEGGQGCREGSQGSGWPRTGKGRLGGST